VIDPVFPQDEPNSADFDHASEFRRVGGLTKLEYFTAHIMSGLCANRNASFVVDRNGLPKVSVQLAKATLAELEKEQS